MSGNEGTIHLHTRLDNDDWTTRQEEVNALILQAVGGNVDNWRAMVTQPEVRAEVRARLDAKNKAIAGLEQQKIQAVEAIDLEIAAKKTDFVSDPKGYLDPLVERAAEADYLAGRNKASFAAGLKPGAITPATVAETQGTGFSGKAAS